MSLLLFAHQANGIRTKTFSYILKHILRLNLAVNFHLNGEVIINIFVVVICCFSVVYVCLLFFYSFGCHLANWRWILSWQWRGPSMRRRWMADTNGAHPAKLHI